MYSDDGIILFTVYMYTIHTIQHRFVRTLHMGIEGPCEFHPGFCVSHRYVGGSRTFIVQFSGAPFYILDQTGIRSHKKRREILTVSLLKVR